MTPAVEHDTQRFSRATLDEVLSCPAEHALMVWDLHGVPARQRFLAIHGYNATRMGRYGREHSCIRIYDDDELIRQSTTLPEGYKLVLEEINKIVRIRQDNGLVIMHDDKQHIVEPRVPYLLAYRAHNREYLRNGVREFARNADFLFTDDTIENIKELVGQTRLTGIYDFLHEPTPELPYFLLKKD